MDSHDRMLSQCVGIPTALTLLACREGACPNRTGARNGHSKHDVEAEVLEYLPPSHCLHVEKEVAAISLEKTD